MFLLGVEELGIASDEALEKTYTRSVYPREVLMIKRLRKAGARHHLPVDIDPV